MPSGDEYRLAEADEPASVKPQLVRVTCGTCGTLMYAKLENVGKRIRCPDCQALSVIPAAKVTAAPFTPPDVSDIRIDAAPPPRIDETRKEVADRLMAAAMEHVQVQERIQPTPPKRPLSEGIYGFPFMLNVIPVWLVLGAGCAVVLHLVEMIISVMAAPGPQMGIVIILIPVSALLTGTIWGISAPGFLHIIEFTSEGYHRSPHWPSNDFGSRIRAVVFWFNALAMATAPGMLLVRPLTGYGVPTWLGFISTVLLLPLVVLSMLELDSAFMPFSPVVYRVLRRNRTAWFKTTLHFIALGAGIVLLEAAALQFTPTWAARLLGVFACSIALVIACRVIGRLAYVLSLDAEFNPPDVEDEDEDEGNEADEHPTAEKGVLPSSVPWR